MTAGDEQARTIAHLKATLDSSGLPEAQRERGEALYSRLTSPVRLTLIGLPGSGKTELVNLLAGRRILPAGTDMPTTELVWGEVAEARVVRADGSEDRPAWPVADDYDWSDAVFVKVHSPAPVLKDLSFLEIVTDGSPEDLSSALNWAIPRTDITLWCSQAFSRLEHALWVQVPDVMKDHGNLVVTRADELSARGDLPETLKRLAGIVAEEFHNLYAVATIQYIDAMDNDGNPPERIRSTSGGGTLVDAIRGHVRSGREADLDGALLFLAKYGVDEVPEPVAEAPKPPEKPVEMAEPSATEDPSGNLEDAITYLNGRCEMLAALADAEDGDLTDQVLETCTETVLELVLGYDSLRFIGPELAEEVEQASEMVVLMQLEAENGSAADAATVILQIRRELEFAQAA